MKPCPGSVRAGPPGVGTGRVGYAIRWSSLRWEDRAWAWARLSRWKAPGFRGLRAAAGSPAGSRLVSGRAAGRAAGRKRDARPGRGLLRGLCEARLAGSPFNSALRNVAVILRCCPLTRLVETALPSAAFQVGGVACWVAIRRQGLRTQLELADLTSF